MDDSKNPVARNTGLVVLEMPDEVLVYDMDANRAHCLNASAAFIWQHCDGRNTVLDIAREFAENAPGNVTEDLVWLAIDQLIENDLLENKIARRFAVSSRRHILKTIGLASIAVLPIIASLVAPKRAFGVTSCGGCSSNVQCGLPQNAGCPSTTICNRLGECAPEPPSQAKGKIG
jgi:hypothetical protein